MTPDTKVEVTAEVREAVLSTIQHEAYRTLAGFIMDGLTLEQIQAKVGFDELQYKSMVDHIAKISAETVAKPEVATPEVTSETPNAINVPVTPATPASEVGSQTGIGQIQASEVKEVVGSTGNDVPMTQPEATTAPVADVLNAPEASQPANTANTEELTA